MGEYLLVLGVTSRMNLPVYRRGAMQKEDFCAEEVMKSIGTGIGAVHQPILPVGRRVLIITNHVVMTREKDCATLRLQLGTLFKRQNGESCAS